MAHILRRAISSGRIECRADEVILGAAIVQRDYKSTLRWAWAPLFDLLHRRWQENNVVVLANELPYGRAFIVLTTQRLIALKLRHWSQGPGVQMREWPIDAVRSIKTTSEGLQIRLAGDVDYELLGDKNSGCDQISDAWAGIGQP